MNMLRLESYLSPFLLSYLSKYIKDIEAKNLQLSLWGGDAVLHNLQFKLDALDNEIGNAPFSFVSCQAQELRIHVPWSKLASESVVVTLSTMECVVKLNCHKSHKRPKPPEEKKDAAVKQPSYVDTLITKIKNNLTVKVNNLILKYVEDDIVLSVNIQSAVIQSVNDMWEPAFIELTEKSPVLRRVFELRDTTVCLDKRGASGLVESFEDPLLFRCHFVLRQHSLYPSHTSRKPSCTKMNLLIDRYELNISENQLPSVLHLLELCLHLYYGSIELTPDETESTVSSDDDESDQQGWASWAWSYVPPVMSYEMQENEEKNPIFAFGLYIKNIVIRFKPSRVEVTKQFHRSQSPPLKPLVEMTATGMYLEMVARGLEFFSCETSLCNGSISFEGGLPSKLDMKQIPNLTTDGGILLASSGGSLVGFAADSLFDFRSPENNDTPFEYALSKQDFFVDKERCHSDVFFSQYLYIAEDVRDAEEQDEVEFNNFLKHAQLTDVDQWSNFHERSWKRFIIGGESCHIALSSYTLLCMDVLVAWSKNHNLKPYTLAPKSSIATPEILKDLHFVPTRSATVTLKNINIAIPALSLQPETYKEKLFNRVDVLGKGLSTQLHTHQDFRSSKLPTVVVKIPAATFTMVQPMYARHFATYLSCYLSPLPRLMDSCNTRYTAEILSVKTYLWFSDAVHLGISNLPTTLKPVLKFEDIVMENHTLQSKEVWKKRLTMLQSQTKFILHSISVDASPFKLEMLAHISDSWFNCVQKKKKVDEVLDVCFLESKFDEGNSCHLRAVGQNLTVEVNETFANISICGSLKALDFHLYSTQHEIFPIMQSTHYNESTHLPESFLESSTTVGILEKSEKRSLKWNEDTHWLSFYIQIPYNTDDSGCVLVNLHQVFINVDPLALAIIARMPAIPPKQLLPVLSTPTSCEESTKVEQSTSFLQLENKYAVQVRSKGIHVFVLQNTQSVLAEQYQTTVASKIIRQNMKTNDSQSVLCVCFPELTAFTSGFKRIKIAPHLLKQGVQVNKFTEFGTLNFGMEHASIYTAFVDSNSSKALYITKPCSATCTFVIKQPVTEAGKINVAVHLDVEPIDLKISKQQVELLVKICNSAITLVHDLLGNCSSAASLPSRKSISKDQVLTKAKQQPKLVAVKTTISKSVVDDSKSNISVLEPSPRQTKFPFTVWLQCTLPRFSVAVYSAAKQHSKAMLCIEDVSLSLDCQSVYLKLMSSFTTCNFTHLSKSDEGQWCKGDLMGFMMTPMFSVLPSFIQKYDAPKHKPPPHAPETSTKQGKFFDVTFTQALTSDYHRHLQEDSQESVDPANSSVVTAASDQVSRVKANISELICTVHPFDLLVNPDVISEIFLVFSPLLQVSLGQSEEMSGSGHSIDLPVLYFTIGGTRLFFPTNKDTLRDDVLMVCLGNFEINPHPLNPLSRLVLAPSIYRRANAAGLLHTVGSSLEDKQFDINIQDISIGTTKSSDIIAYLKKPVHCENPALQWNISGEMFHMSEPVFHPIIEQFDIQATMAPPMRHKNSSNRWINVCAPSVEVNFTTDVIVHITTMQIKVLFGVSNNWLGEYKKLQDTISLLHNSSDIQCLFQHEDSGFSVCESSQASEKTIQSANWRFMGDCLLTGQKLKVLFYQFQEDDRVNPLCSVEVQEPSFVVHVSKHQQKLELQFHDAGVNVSDGNSKSVTSVHDFGNFPLKVLETQAGDNDERTGVPPSLCTLSAQHFLTKKAELKALFGRPLKLCLHEDAITVLRNTLVDLQSILPPNHSTPVVVKQESSDTSQKFSSLLFRSSQIVVEVKCSSHAVRCALSGSRVNLQAKNLNMHCDVTANDISVRLSSPDKEFAPLMLPITLKMFAESSNISVSNLVLYRVSLNSTAVHLIVGVGSIKSLNVIYNAVEEWRRKLIPHDGASAMEILTKPDYICLVKNDDLRKGNYSYITSEDQEPLPNQIVFSSKLPESSMSWCYDRPHALKHVYITPIPFNEILGDHSEIVCMLESYSELKHQYESQKEFVLSETRHVDFQLFDDDTPFHEITSSTKWRVTVHNTDSCHVSPLSLAASMDLESVFDTRLVSNLSADISVDKISITALGQQADKEAESIGLNISDINTSIKLWQHSSSKAIVATSGTLSSDVMEFQNLTWLPILLPVPFDISLTQRDKTINVSGSFKDTTEVHVSQRAVHSLHYLTSVWKTFEESQDHSPKLVLKNYSNQTLLFGQALTDECISLASGCKTSYTWRTTKAEPKLHVSVEGLPDWIWSDTFHPGSSRRFCCNLDNSKSLVVAVDCSSTWNTVVTFRGRTSIENRLPYNVQARMLVEGCIISSDVLTTTSISGDFLYHISDITSLTLRRPESDFESSPSLFVSDLTEFNENVKMIRFLSVDNETSHAQVCYHQEGLVDVFSVLPLFMVRSYLPTPTILHIETRCQQESSTIKLQGHGEEISLQTLSPYETHHLTIQPNESESPFDATIPIHFSLTDTMINNFKLSDEPLDLRKKYPFNDPNYVTDLEETWSAGDGNIQAKLSLHRHSLMVEVTPWCLVSNETSVVLCFISPDENVSIVQPGEITIPHHFTGMFNMRTSISSCSEWMTLSGNQEFDHPSRSDKFELSYIPHNSSRNILLKKKRTILDFNLKSCVRHGIRVLTVTPRWWFINLSGEVKHMQVTACVSQHTQHLSKKDTVIEINTDSQVPLLEWRLEAEPETDKDEDVKDASILSTLEETTSSFLCVEQNVHEPSLRSAFVDRAVCFHAMQLVSMVSVQSDFIRRLVEFHSTANNVLCKTLLLTKHEYDDSLFLVCSDVREEKYELHNNLPTTLHLQEVTDKHTAQIQLQISPNESIKFESFMDSETFPKCMRKYRQIKMQIREDNNPMWSDFLLSAKSYEDELLLPDARLIFIKVTIEQGCAHVYFQEKADMDPPTTTVSSSQRKCFNSEILFHELKFVLMDDLSNPLHSIDILQVCFDQVKIEMSNCAVSRQWVAKLSLQTFQVDNQLYPSSDFPVFLTSRASEKNSLHVQASFTDKFLLDLVEVSVEPLELRCEGEFAQTLSKLLQSYVDSAQFLQCEEEHPDALIVEDILNEVKVLSNPLRFQALIIHPVTLMVSIRASVKLYVSVDRGVVSFSKFACRDVDTTFREIVQELTRHYLAEAIYGAGWVIGSLDLLGNPASTIRSFAQGVSDFVVMPYQGLMNGPTAFIGGFTRGFSSLLKHFSSGTLRSVTNIASGISRNLNYISYDEHQHIKTSQSLLNAGTHLYEKSNTSAESKTTKAEHGYVAGVTKALVGVVTKPLGGAAGIVSKTGESILKKVGLEEHKTVRHSSVTHAIASYRNSLTKYAEKMIGKINATASQLFSLDCKMVSSTGVNFSASLIISPDDLYIVRREDDTLETSVPIKDLRLILKENSNDKQCILTIQQMESVPEDKDVVYSEKVADYLGVNSQTKVTATDDSDIVQYTAVLDGLTEARTFFSTFNLMKPKTNRFRW